MGSRGEREHRGGVRFLPLLPTFTTLIAAHVLRAQSMTGIPAVDSATVARAAWSRASAALQRQDVAAARSEIDRAARAWPTQATYSWASAVLAAHASDTSAALHALDAYADLGVGHSISTDSALASLARTPSFASTVERLRANDSAIARSHTRATIGDSTTWPEGMDYDARTRRFYVADVAHRTVIEIADGRSRDLWPRDRGDLSSVLAVRVDTAHDVLWVTTSPTRQTPGFVTGDTTHAALLRVRLSDGAIEHRWELPPSPIGHVLGDLAIGPRGDVFITDSSDPVLYRLRPGASALEAVRHPLFRSLQGLAPDPSGRVLYLADYSHGFLRVDLSTAAVDRIDDAPRSTSLGCDGIAWYEGSLIAVQNGVPTPRIMRFVLAPGGRRIARADVLDRHVPLADEPTIGAVADHEFVYVANSRWNKYDDSGHRIGSAPLAPPVLLAVPLSPTP
jgi:sugar lactone lactonase YvrE